MINNDLILKGDNHMKILFKEWEKATIREAKKRMLNL